MNTSSFHRPKIFIASSTRAIPIAKELKAKLEAIATVIPWWEGFLPGNITLPTLLKYAADCDFAAVLLTKDDITVKNSRKGVAPRDNCIFELGLFTGALGLRPERAFILTSVEKEALPTDLQGVSYIPITEPGEVSDKAKIAEFEKKLEEALTLIKKNIDEYKRCYDHPKLKVIPSDDLMEMERPKEEGGNLERVYGVEVIVHSTQPIEKNHEVAKIVQQNMDDEVSYNYFFQAEESSLKLLPGLIRIIAAGRLDVDDSTKSNIQYWKNEMTKSDQAQAIVRGGLDNMKRHLRIFLLAHKASVQFCIHNASHESHAICYLRYPPSHFVEWCTFSSAKEVADELKNKRPLSRGNYVFHGSTSYDLYSAENADYRKQLLEGIKYVFPSMFHDLLEDVCFGNNH